MDALRIEVERAGGRSTVSLAGELDDGTAERLRALDLDALGAPEAQDVVIDLRGLEFLDSSGIGSLVSLRNRIAQAGMTMIVENPPEHVRHILTVAGLAGLLGLQR